MSDKPKPMPDNWFLVIGENQDQNTSRLVYQTEEHAEAVAFTKRIEYPTLGPWRVIPLKVAA